MPNRSAIAISRCGRNVPSVSMYMALPSAPPCASGKLARHRQRVAQLRLSRPELAVNLSQRARLETPPEKLVEL